MGSILTPGRAQKQIEKGEIRGRINAWHKHPAPTAAPVPRAMRLFHHLHRLGQSLRICSDVGNLSPQEGKDVC